MTVNLGLPEIPPAPLAPRRASRQIMVGKGKHAVPVGGGAPVSVQSMTTTLTADVNATLQQIAELTAAGAGPGTLRFTAEPGLDLTTLSPRLPAGRHVTEDRPGWYVVDGEIGPDVLSLVTAWCAEQGVMPRDLLVGRRSLEDLFLELTGRELR